MTGAFKMGAEICDDKYLWGGRCVVQTVDLMLPSGCFVRVDLSGLVSELLWNSASGNRWCSESYVCNMLCMQTQVPQVEPAQHTPSSSGLAPPTTTAAAPLAPPEGVPTPEPPVVLLSQEQCGGTVCKNFGFQANDCTCFGYGVKVWWAARSPAADGAVPLIHSATSWTRWPRRLQLARRSGSAQGRSAAAHERTCRGSLARAFLAFGPLSLIHI